MKDPTQKAHFYRNTLKDVLPYIHRVSTRSRILRISILHRFYHVQSGGGRHGAYPTVKNIIKFELKNYHF